MDFLIGILALIAGAGLCLAGLRIFFIMLPIWGFVAGFFMGGALVTAVFDDGFLATTFGIVVGLVFGVIFALISYFYWYFAVLLAFGYTGGVLAGALFSSLGVDADWLLFIIGLAGAALFVFAAVAFQLPALLVVANTALAGAAIAIGGLLLVINRVDRDEIGSGVVWEKINDNWFLWIVWLVAAAVGVGAQLTRNQETTLPEDRWTKAGPVSAA